MEEIKGNQTEKTAKNKKNISFLKCFGIAVLVGVLNLLITKIYVGPVKPFSQNDYNKVFALVFAFIAAFASFVMLLILDMFLKKEIKDYKLVIYFVLTLLISSCISCYLMDMVNL
ncbi:hypothetical protein [Flavobacterium notoginsengisoli]|uniref:hypothetical protein n=1 Tax=Flavobacterium notoginsengisoli TaxID=1478199 RepID=UPI00363F4C10